VTKHRAVTININVLEKAIRALDGMGTTQASCAAHELRYNLVPDLPSGVSVLDEPKETTS
jgi:hypothetical protein